MRLTKKSVTLSQKGHIHFVLPLLVFALIAIIGGYVYLRASSAAPVTNAVYFDSGIAGKCLDVWHDGKANGTKVDLYRCNKTAAQQWTINSNGTIVDANGACLDNWQQKAKDGNPIKIYHCSTTDPAEQWRQVNTHELRNPETNMCLDDRAFSTTDGIPLELWSCNGGKNQQWLPTPVSTTSPGGSGNAGGSGGTSSGGGANNSGGGSTSGSGGTTPSGSSTGFISTSGNKLMLNGQQYRSVGFNFSPVGSCWSSNWSTAQMDQFFQNVPKGSLARFFAPPGGTDSAAFVQSIVKEADKYNVHLIISLAVAGVYGNCDTENAASGGNGKTAAYYTSAVQPGSTYANWVQSVVKPLANDPGVAMWEIVNEPWLQGATLSQIGGVSAAAKYTNAAAALRSAETAGAGKPKQLLTLAPADIGDTGGVSGMEAIFKNLDVVDDHDYSGDLGGSSQYQSSEFPTLVQIAQALNKPFMVDETGVEAGSSCSSSNVQNAWDNASNGLSLQSRVNFLLTQKTTAYLKSGASAVDFWLYTAPGMQESGCVYENITPSDPIMAAVRSYRMP